MSTPEPVRMLRLLYGSVLANAVSAVAEIGVADLLTDGARPVAELAAESGTHPDALRRVLRALVTAEVFAEPSPGCFALTPLGETLRGDVPGSMRDHARNWGGPEYQRSFAGIDHSLRTGRPSFDEEFGTGFWAHLAAHPGRAERFDRAMSARARQLAVAAAAALDLTGVRRVVDVGGGRGQLAASLLDRDPDLHVTVFDRPDVAAGAAAALAGYGGRADCVGGDFFAEVPANADRYLLSSVLHDWADAEAAAILGTVRRAMRPDSQVVLVELVLTDEDPMGPLLDLVMLTLAGGRERTEAEFAALFGQAGLRHTATVRTASPASLILAEPA